MTETGWLNTHDSLKYIVVEESALFADLYLVDFFPLPFPRCRQFEHFQADLSSCKNISVPVRATYLKWYQLLQQSHPMLFLSYLSSCSLHSLLHSGQKKRLSPTVFFACSLFATVSSLSLKAVTLLRKACFLFHGIAVLNECKPSMMEKRRKCSATSSTIIEMNVSSSLMSSASGNKSMKAEDSSWLWKTCPLATR